MAKGGGLSIGSTTRGSKSAQLTSCEAPLLMHDIERPQVCVMAAPRRLAADDIVPMRMALAADGGLLSAQFCHRDDLGRSLRRYEPAKGAAEPTSFERNVIHRRLDDMKRRHA